MFVRDESRRWLHHVLAFRGGVLPRIWRRVVVVTSLSLVLTSAREHFEVYDFSLTMVPFTLVGLPLGIFLGFRNTASYDRFWEARKLWGALVNESRSLTRQWLTLVGPLEAERPAVAAAPEVAAFQRETVLRVVAFAHALRIHLRHRKGFESLAGLLPAGEIEALAQEQNVPIAMVQRMGERLREAWQRGWVHPLHVPVLEQSLRALTDIQGGCERILNTPLPYSYTVLIHQIVAVYCSLLPFGLVETMHWTTPLVVAFISYAFFGLDAVGDELDEPFGLDSNDLPLDALTRIIEINLRERLGDHPLPAPLAPVNGVVT
jgi:putative membrane protein